jgi:hypothetical protein
MNKRRLLALARKLDTVPVERFDISTWVGMHWQGKPDLSCGTVACALGWATTIPSFRRLGLRLIEGSVGLTGYVVLLKDGYKVASNISAAELLFDIDTRTAELLFMPSSYMAISRHVTPKIVARRIRQLVEKGEIDGNW